MGMLMHYTWLKQQEALKAKAKAEDAVEEEIPFTDPPEEISQEEVKKPKAPAKKPVARRKTSK